MPHMDGFVAVGSEGIVGPESSVTVSVLVVQAPAFFYTSGELRIVFVE